MKRAPIKRRRSTPRRREAPRWDADQWREAEGLLLVRSRGLCECCGRRPTATDPVERHHRQRRRDGGDRLANLLRLRRSCHAWWTAHPAAAVDKGIIVRTGMDPGQVPVRVAQRHGWWSWVVLDDDGGARGVGAQSRAQDPLLPPDTPGDITPGR